MDVHAWMLAGCDASCTGEAVGGIDLAASVNCEFARFSSKDQLKGEKDH